MLRPFAFAAAAAFLGAAPLPPNPNLTLTDTSLSIVDAAGRIVSTATVCPGYQFAQLGLPGPKLSPDQHWILIDVLGPFTPGNIARNHAIVDVRDGRLVTAPDFPKYLGVPATLQSLEWASGERATLRYHDGKTATLHDPPLAPFPERTCSGQGAARE